MPTHHSSTDRLRARRLTSGIVAPASSAILTVSAALLLAACGSDAPTSLQDPRTAAGQESLTGSASGTTPTNATSAGRCNGRLGAVDVGNVFVPAGATCLLEGTRVGGNVVVSRDGTLIAVAARVSGNIQAEDARRVSTSAGTTVTGDIQVKRRALAEIANTIIVGNLQVEESGARLVSTDTRIDGDLQVKKAESANVSGAIIDGNLQLEENRLALVVTGSEVRGDLQVVKNLGGVRLEQNRIRQTLECKENQPAPVGSGNVAGEKEEQCRVL